MKPYILGILLLCFPLQHTSSQVVLNADGPGVPPGNTYELINSVLAPGFDAIEAPGEPAGSGTMDNHSAFGRHIDEIMDSDLGINVFRFVIHRDEDNDRGIITTTDRQRNEIKTYDKSPDNLKGVLGETVQYKWKFKIPVGFAPSPNFTHIHQIKAVGGDDGNPIFAITLRKSSSSGSVSKLELNYYPPVTSSATKLLNLDMSIFEGHWFEVTETITYGDATTSAYNFNIKKISDPIAVSYSVNNNSLVTIRPTNTFARPKWGIYRSIATKAGMKDENLLFADFSIEEMNPLSLNEITNESNNISVYPNPASNKITIINKGIKLYDGVHLYDYIGKHITVIFDNNSIDISNLTSGLYFLSFKENNRIIKTIKIIKE